MDKYTIILNLDFNKLKEDFNNLSKLEKDEFNELYAYTFSRAATNCSNSSEEEILSFLKAINNYEIKNKLVSNNSSDDELFFKYLKVTMINLI